MLMLPSLLESKNSPPIFARISPLAARVSDASTHQAANIDGDGYVGEVYINGWRSDIDGGRSGPTESVTLLSVVNLSICFVMLYRMNRWQLTLPLPLPLQKLMQCQCRPRS